MMYPVRKIAAFIVFTVLVSVSGHAQLIMPYVPPVNSEPAVKDIIKKIEDTLRVKQGEIRPEDAKKAEQKAKEFAPMPKDIDEEAGALGNAEKAGEVKAGQNTPDKLLKEAQKAAETTEKLVETATKELREKLDTVPIFGFDYFRRKDIKLFNNAVDIKPPLNYVLGVGDQIVVSIWGYADYNRLFYIDKDGYIQQENIGRMYLKGLTLQEAKDLLRTRFANAYMIDKSQFDVSLNYSRVVTIHVVGDVENPGSYTFPAINTAYNILAYVGGPTKSGTIRDIQVKRDGQIIQRFDLYKFLFEPEKQGDIFLNNNDYIYVPHQYNLVTVEGEVNKPGNYEMLPGETLDDLLKYCGGFKPNAFKTVVQVRRFLDNKSILIDYNLDSLKLRGEKLTLVKGDVVMVRAIPDNYRNYVEIAGPVMLPGIYELREGDRIRDLFIRSQGFKPDIYMDEGFLVRTNIDDGRKTIYNFNLDSAMNQPMSDDNMPLQILDKIEVYSKSYYLDTFSIYIQGEVRNPRRFPMEKDMTLRDGIMMSGGFTDFAFLDKIIIYRMNDDYSEKVISFRVDTTDNFAALDTFPLKKRDRIIVQKDLSKIDTMTIEVNGLIRAPGTYRYLENMTLADALILAKGFKMEAASNRIEIARIANFDKAIAQSVPTQMTILSFSISKNIGTDAVANSTKLQPYDQIYVRVTPEFEYQQKIHIDGEVLYPGDYVITTKDEKLASLIDRAGGLSRYAYPKGARLYRKEDGIGDVLLDLDKALKKKNSKYNYILRKDDSIFIPAIKDLVVLQGEFGYPNINRPENLYVPYSAGKSARYYIKTYGAGFSTVAGKSKVYVIQPNGMIQKKNPSIEKGSTIVIPVKEKKPKKEPKVRTANGSDNLYKVLNATVGSITSVLTMYLLIQTILKN